MYLCLSVCLSEALWIEPASGVPASTDVDRVPGLCFCLVSGWVLVCYVASCRHGALCPLHAAVHMLG